MVACLQCGQEFESKPSWVAAGRSKFCSRVCYGHWQSENRIGENAPQWKGGRVVKKCKQCGKEFEAYPERAKSAQFCSKRCYGQSLLGENSPHWQGGISFEPYTFEFNDKLKETIRDRDGHVCAICKLPEEDITLHVHHIDYCKENSNVDNLISLCNSCHPATNSNRKYWQWALSPLSQLHEQAPSVLRGMVAK